MENNSSDLTWQGTIFTWPAPIWKRRDFHFYQFAGQEWGPNLMIFLVRNGPSGHLRAGPVDVTAKGGEKGPGAISPLLRLEGGGVYPSCKDGSPLDPN